MALIGLYKNLALTLRLKYEVPTKFSSVQKYGYVKVIICYFNFFVNMYLNNRKIYLGSFFYTLQRVLLAALRLHLKFHNFFTPRYTNFLVENSYSLSSFVQK